MVAVSAIGGLSVVLAVGLAALGVLDRLNALAGGLVSRGGREGFPKQLPEWSLWLVTMALAFGLAFAILSTPGLWRRVVLWVSSLVLVAAWAPVLSLAAHVPAVGGPWVATLWSGVCAIIYASRHHMACDPEEVAR